MKRILALSFILVALIAVTVAGEDPAAAPDEVEIGILADWFTPVSFSHGFHAELTDCSDCHHNSDGFPLPCADCHSPGAEVPGADMPGLMIAYHQQCMGCHEELEAGPLDCDSCHQRQRLPAGPPLGVAAH